MVVFGMVGQVCNLFCLILFSQCQYQMLSRKARGEFERKLQYLLILLSIYR